MTLNGMLLRFAALHYGLLLTSELAFFFLGKKAPTFLSGGFLFGSVFVVCLWFARANGRAFEPAEARTAGIDMWLIAVVGSVLVLLGRGIAGGIGPWTMLMTMFGPMLGLLLLVFAMQLFAIWFGIKIAFWLRTLDQKLVGTQTQKVGKREPG